MNRFGCKSDQSSPLNFLQPFEHFSTPFASTSNPLNTLLPMETSQNSQQFACYRARDEQYFADPLGDYDDEGKFLDYPPKSNQTSSYRLWSPKNPYAPSAEPITYYAGNLMHSSSVCNVVIDEQYWTRFECIGNESRKAKWSSETRESKVESQGWRSEKNSKWD